MRTVAARHILFKYQLKHSICTIILTSDVYFQFLFLSFALAIPAVNDEEFNRNNSAGQGVTLNPLSPHDALKEHFTSLKTHLIILQLRVLERKFPLNWFTNTIFFNFSPTSNHLHPLQVENCDSGLLWMR